MAASSTQPSPAAALSLDPPQSTRPGKLAHVLGGAAREVEEVVAALETGDDASLAVALGERHQLARDPAVVALDETQPREEVRDRVEPLRALRVAFAHLVAAAVGVADPGAGPGSLSGRGGRRLIDGHQSRMGRKAAPLVDRRRTGAIARAYDGLN